MHRLGSRHLLMSLATAALLASAMPPTVAVAQTLPRAAAVAGGWQEHEWKSPDGSTFHWAEQGSGVPVILVHGFGGSAIGNWFSNGFAASLSRTNRVIGIDMRGHGLTTNPQGQRGDRTGDMAQDVIDFMDAHGIQKAHIGGYSMGGFVTATLMARHPERFITAHFGGSGLGEVGEWVDRVPADKTGDGPEEELAREAYYAIQAQRQAAANSIGNAMPRATDGAARPALPTPPPMPNVDLSTITFPVLAVNGEYDFPYRKTHRLWRELSNFQNVILADGGHLSAVMEGFVPQLYIDELTAFVVRNNPKP